MKIRTTILCVTMLLTGTFVYAQKTVSGIDKAGMDLTVKPGNDFYKYAVGHWLATHPLDAEHSSNGPFLDVEEMNNLRIQGIIKEYSSKAQPKGTLGQKIGSLYNLIMDSVRLNREGIAPLKPILAKLAAIKNKREYQIVSSKLDLSGQCRMLFSLDIDPDQHNSLQFLVSVSQGGLTGIRDYYLSDDPQSKQLREMYKKMLKQCFMIVGDDEATAVKKVNVVMDLETRIAKSHYDQVKLRDVDANFHKISYFDLINDYPGIDWGNILLAQGVPALDYINVAQPEAIHEVEKILNDTPLDNLKIFAESKAILSSLRSLDDNCQKIFFIFSQAITGRTQDQPRWKKAVSAVSGGLSDAIGKLYVEKYFPESSKQQVIGYVKALQEALRQRINESSWMTTATKMQAIDKLNNFIIKIGYPNKWRDYADLDINDSLSLYENNARLSEFTNKYYYNKYINKPVDKSDWLSPPQTVNAFYSPSANSICFPAAILQAPFFDPSADDAVNLGAIGAIIGHEMSHGFDDQGCQFDKYGNQKNWWNAADKKNFEVRTKVLENFFGNIEVIPGKKINGKQTLGENIGDNGGLNIAFRALQNIMKEKNLGVVDGFTPEQRFFLSFARVWESNVRPEYLNILITSDVHSPHFARVNAALPQIDAWYDAFKVKKDDKLFIPKAKRARIW